MIYYTLSWRHHPWYRERLRDSANIRKYRVQRKHEKKRAQQARLVSKLALKKSRKLFAFKNRQAIVRYRRLSSL